MDGELVNVCAWLAGLFPDRAQQEVWGSNPRAMDRRFACRLGEARPTDGGWLVNGRWPWASGCSHAQWAACGILMKNEQGEMADLGLSLTPMTDLTIEDTWHMAGMKGTAEYDRRQRRIRAEHRFLPYPGAFQGSYRTEHKDEALYRAALRSFHDILF